jgi:hypothetical protein
MNFHNMPGPNLSLTWSMNCVHETKRPNRKTFIKKEGDRILKSTLSFDFIRAEEKSILKEK